MKMAAPTGKPQNKAAVSYATPKPAAPKKKMVAAVKGKVASGPKRAY